MLEQHEHPLPHIMHVQKATCYVLATEPEVKISSVYELRQKHPSPEWAQ